jgi:homoserine acetyltransferase
MKPPTPVYVKPVDASYPTEAQRMRDAALRGCQQHHLVITDPAGHATVEEMRQNRAEFLKDALRWHAWPEAS